MNLIIKKKFNLFDIFKLQKGKVYSIVGIAKNSGKTTLLNRLLTEIYLKGYTAGITSIGLDGEQQDAYFKNPKPPINVYKDFYIATAKNFLKSISCDFQIYENTGISTIFGEIYIIKSCGNTQIKILGPRTLNQIKKVIDKLKKYSDYVFIDGALDRLSSSSPFISDGFILLISTGYETSYIKIKKKIYELKSRFENVIYDNYDKIIIKLKNNFIEKNSIILINSKECKFKLIPEFKTILNNEMSLIYLIEKYDGLYLPGALTDFSIEKMYKKLPENFKFYLLDPTRNFISSEMYKKINQKNIKIITLFYPELIGIATSTFNPRNNLTMSPDKLIELVKIIFKDVPVIDLFYTL